MKDGLNVCKDGTKMYFRSNKLHRNDGPALIYKSGREVHYLEGKKMKKKEFILQLNKIQKDFEKVTNLLSEEPTS